MEEKRKEKYIQARYRRELERYLNRVVGFAMDENFQKKDYGEFIDKVAKKLEDIQKTRLYNDYFERLEAFVEKTKQLKESDLDDEEIRSEILYEANQIRKSKRKKSYSRKKKQYGNGDSD